MRQPDCTTRAEQMHLHEGICIGSPVNSEIRESPVTASPTGSNGSVRESGAVGSRHSNWSSMPNGHGID